MKIVINVCFGGFGLSPLALKEYTKLKGKECYFFNNSYGKPYESIEIENAGRLGYSAFSVPNPNELLPNKDDEHYNHEEFNKIYSEITIWDGDIDRTDKDLITVVELLKDKANGGFAELKIVDIPDNIEWEIDDYDGSEHIAEIHRTWC